MSVVSRNSLAYAILAGAIAYVVLIGVWGVLNQPVAALTDTNSWENGSRYPDTQADEHAAEGQRMVHSAWMFTPGLIAFALGFSLLTTARDRGVGG